MGNVKISDLQADQFLAAQRPAVGQREHEPVAQSLLRHLGNEPCPVGFGRNVGHADQAAHQATL